MKFKFLIVLAIAGMAAVGCSSSKNGNGTMDSSAVDSTKVDTMGTTTDTSRTTPDTTKTKPDTTRNQ